MRSIILLSVVIFMALLAARSAEQPRAVLPKHDLPWFAGVTVADEPKPYDSPSALEVYAHLLNLGVRAVALTPSAHVPDIHQPTIRWRERNHIREAVPLLHARGMRVLLKPYLWSHQFYESELWTGSIAMTSEADWKTFFKNYSEFILEYARIAEATNVDLFCVGVELPTTFAHVRAWQRLIADVRAVYHGAITYAATGVDEAEVVPFWPLLDVIGVDAFFPITDSLRPTNAELRRGWESYRARLSKIASTHSKRVIFTEAGYKSCVGSACKPWEWVEHTPHPADLDQQARCYNALADAVFGEPWFGGLFWWKYYTALEGGGINDIDFTPYGKPAEDVMGTRFRALRK
jgi:hypothetical protein